MRRIPSGVVDQYIYFVAVDATDLTTFETGLSSFTVRRSRNGAASAAFTTPTINETDSSNMPGVYELLLDEDMTLDAGDHSQEVCLRITHAGMAPVTLVYEIYRPDVTAGETATVSSGNINAAVQSIANNAIAAASIATGAITAAKFAAGAIDAAAIADNAIDAGSIATGAITAAKFAAGAIDAAAIASDAIGALELAAGAASEIATAVRTELTTELGRIDTTVSSRLASASYTSPPSANDNADALLDRANGIETGLTPRQALRIVAATLAGKLAITGGDTWTFRNAVADSADRVVATVDNTGRTAVTYNL